jgi:hypothetical protein
MPSTEPLPTSATQRTAGATASRWFHGVLAALVASALLIDLGLILLGGSGAEPSGLVLSKGTRVVNYVSYFTIQSNVLVAVVAATLALDPARSGRLWRVLRLDAVLAIVITGIVYALLLAGTQSPVGIGVFTNTVLHYVSPWATMLGWVAFGPRRRLTWRVVVVAFVWPVLWVAYTFAHGAATGWYPYFFLDVGTLGVPTALRNTVGILAVAGVMALVLLVLDHGLTRLPRRDGPAPAASRDAPARDDPAGAGASAR